MTCPRERRFAAALLVLLLGPPACTREEPAPAARRAATRFERRERVVERFHRVWYDDPQTWRENRWLGIRTLQNPMDAWITQEIIHEVRPDYFVECGASEGGSAALWATVLEQVHPDGRVLSIDIVDRMREARKLPVVQRRVEFILGSSTDPEVMEHIRRRVQGRKVIVLLDSLHHRDHVLAELRAYAPMVSPGSYIIVQDTNVGGHPIQPNFNEGRGGPWEAVEEFLKETDAFEPDRSRERLLFTFCPNGYLKRRS